MDIIITLKDGSEHTLPVFRLMECGIDQKTFFLENKKKGRVEFPIDSLSGFRIDRPKALRVLPEAGDFIVLNTASIILSQLLP